LTYLLALDVSVTGAWQLRVYVYRPCSKHVTSRFGERKHLFCRNSDGQRVLFFIS